MPAIHLDGLSFSYTSTVILFEDISLHLGPTWHGLVGANGGGKTTLLRLISGGLTPDRGRTICDPSDAVVAYVSQTVDQPDEGVVEFAESTESVDYARRGRLGLEPEQLSRWEVLSPGERKRWQIGAAMEARPDVLLVDEPTNHLDGDARELLVGELSRFDGVGVVVSHDRELLDRLTTHTMRVTKRGVSLHGGNYTVASSEWRTSEAELLARAAGLRRQEKHLAARVARRQRDLEETGARQARRRRSGDSDARSIGVKNHGAFVEKVKGRELRTDHRRLERIGEQRASLDAPRTSGGPIIIDPSRQRRSVLLSFEGTLAIEGRELLESGPITVDRGERIRVAGWNGSGKTTLLEVMLRDTTLPDNEILWVPQELDRSQRERVAERISAIAPKGRGELLAMSARLGLDPDRVLASARLSPGEARKLVIAEGLSRGVAVAVLDEPTNHLDLPSIERVEEALEGYPGALVVVSHDERFIRPLVDLTWTIEDGTIHITNGA